MTDKKDDKYPEDEAERRFLGTVKAALNTPPKPLKDMPRRWSGKKRAQRRKKAKSVAA
jgi:hypothetical protein